MPSPVNEPSWGTSRPVGGGEPFPHLGASPAGPVYETDEAAHTRPVPVVPDAVGGQPAGSESRSPSPNPVGQPPGRKRAGRDLPAAVGVGMALGAVVLASLFIYKPVFVGVVVLAVVVGLWELTTRFAERQQIRVPLAPLAVGGAAMVILGYAKGAEWAWGAMVLTALGLFLWRMASSPRNYLRDATTGVFALFYVPFLATFVTLLLAADDGPQRVLTFLLLTVLSDTGAYAVGWRFGRRKLAPRISPGKTLEGLAGAVLFAMAGGALCMEFLIEDGRWWQGLLLGLAVAISATLGDLGESMIKRDLGIKDMGTLLPGHGGIMDRLDSLLPTAPVAWLLFLLLVGGG